MRKKSIKAFGLLPGGLATSTERPNLRIWILGAMAALLPLVAVVAEGQSDGASVPRQTRPGDSGLGPAAPWSVEGSPLPPEDDGMRRKRPEDDLWGRAERSEKRLPRLRCQILEIEELGRIHVQEFPAGSPYWIQLPSEVKIRPARSSSFGGRRKLTLDDLEVGQRLVVTLKKGTDEIVKVVVSPAKV